jgi:hypothetical protein
MPTPRLIPRLALLLATSVPARAAAQDVPPPLVAIPVLHVSPDSARAFFAGKVLVDRAGLVLFERAPEPLPRRVVTTILSVSPDGRIGHGVPGDSDLRGTLHGWVGSPRLDSLWIGQDTAVVVLGPMRNIIRSISAAGDFEPLTDSTSWYNFATLAVYSDGTVLDQLYRREPNWRGIGGETSHAVLARVDTNGRWQRLVATHPWTAQCHALDRTGKDFTIPVCADSRIGVSPSGNHIAEAFVEPGLPGFTVISLSAQGDTVFRKHLVMQTVPIPDGVMKSIVRMLDSLLAPDARAVVPVPTHRRDFSTVLAGDDGTVWIDLATPGGVPHRWIELDRRGKLVGQVLMPPFTRLSGGLSDALWGLEQEPAGPRFGVVRYKITKP